jgi:transposase
VTKREKARLQISARRAGRGHAAPLPARIIAKSLVSDRDHHRHGRRQILRTTTHFIGKASAFLRDAGIDISRATMCGWVMTIGEMLMPVAGAMRRRVACRHLHPGG